MDNITFEKLSPTTDADVKVYKEAFDFVFSNNDVSIDMLQMQHVVTTTYII